MQAIETTGTIDIDGQLQLDQPLQETRSRRVRIIVLLTDETAQDPSRDRNTALDPKTALENAPENTQVEPSFKLPVWERVAKISAQISDQEWAELPNDLSKNLDHYLYGSPKIEE